VTFKPTDSSYSFGRLADPEDIARYGPLSRLPNMRHGKTGDTGAYPPEEVAQMAHSLAVKAIKSLTSDINNNGHGGSLSAAAGGARCLRISQRPSWHLSPASAELFLRPRAVGDHKSPAKEAGQSHDMDFRERADRL